MGRKPQLFGRGSKLPGLWVELSELPLHEASWSSLAVSETTAIEPAGSKPSVTRPAEPKTTPRSLHSSNDHIGREFMHVRESAPQEVQAVTLLYQHSSLATGKWFSGRGWRFLGVSPPFFRTQNQ